MVLVIGLMTSVTDFTSVPTNQPRYRYARIPLNNIVGNQVNIGATSNQLLEWKLAARNVMNLSRSFIGYDYIIPASGANTYNASFECVEDLASYVYFGDGSGVAIVDLNNADRYSKAIVPLRTPYSLFQTKDPCSTQYPSRGPNSSTLAGSPSTVEIQVGNMLPFSRDGLTTGNNAWATSGYTEMQYLNFGSVNNPLAVYRHLQLGHVFPDTYLGQDKDTVYGKDMYLRFYTQYGNRLGVTFTTNNGDPPNGLGSTSNVTAIALPALAVSFNNVYLYLALEQNNTLVQSMLSALDSGAMQFSYPYVYSWRFGGTAQTSATFNIPITRMWGDKLKAIYFTAFNANENGGPTNGLTVNGQQFDHSNVNGSKIKQLQSSMDSRPLTDYMLNCFNPYDSATAPAVSNGFLWTQAGSPNIPGTLPFDDYREMKKYLQGTVYQTIAQYQTNWVYADMWGVPPASTLNKSGLPDENIADGLDITDSDHVWTLNATQGPLTVANSTTANGLVYYVFAKFTRNIKIAPDGVAFLPSLTAAAPM